MSFVIKFTDGLVIQENHAVGITWDSIPDDRPIDSVMLVFGGQMVGLCGCEKYYFSNEAVSFVSTDPKKAAGFPDRWAGHFVGGEKNGIWHEIYLGIDGRIKQEINSSRYLKLAPHCFKKGKVDYAIN